VHPFCAARQKLTASWCSVITKDGHSRRSERHASKGLNLRTDEVGKGDDWKSGNGLARHKELRGSGGLENWRIGGQGVRVSACFSNASTNLLGPLHSTTMGTD
jgi:hypothetical protein